MIKSLSDRVELNNGTKIPGLGLGVFQIPEDQTAEVVKNGIINGYRLIRYANLHLDNINIDILEYVEPKSTKANYSNEQISAMHLCFEVDDIEAAVARMKEIGVEPEGEPIYFEKSDGLKAGFGIGVVYFKDPDGINLELIAPKGPFQRERN